LIEVTGAYARVYLSKRDMYHCEFCFVVVVG
jgi:hypothetical protein